MHGAEPTISLVKPSEAAAREAPLVIEQAPEGSGRIVLIVVAAIALTALALPFGLVVSHALSEPATRAIFTSDPALALHLVVGFFGAATMFGWPLAQLSHAELGRRRVTIDGRDVRSIGVGLLGGGSWTEPLTAYRGVSPRVRSSVSGVRHELVLMHTRRNRCVVLCSGPAITPEMLAMASRLPAFAEIPSRETDSVSSSHGSERSSQRAA